MDSALIIGAIVLLGVVAAAVGYRQRKKSEDGYEAIVMWGCFNGILVMQQYYTSQNLVLVTSCFMA